MDSLSQDTTIPQIPPPSKPPPVSRLTQLRAWLHTRPGRITLLSTIFVLGIIVGVAGVLLYALSISADQQPLDTPAAPQNGSIVVQVSNAYISQVVQKNLQSSGMPGKVQNVHVQLVHNGPMTVTGDDVLTVLGVNTTKHFTILLQPFIQACQLHVRVLRADLSGIPVTGFVATFEEQINQQLQVKASNLPKGFLYCTVGVRTEPQAMFVTYSATPVG